MITAGRLLWAAIATWHALAGADWLLALVILLLWWIGDFLLHMAA